MDGFRERGTRRPLDLSNLDPQSLKRQADQGISETQLQTGSLDKDALQKTISYEVIPRLMMAHRSRQNDPARVMAALHSNAAQYNISDNTPRPEDIDGLLLDLTRGTETQAYDRTIRWLEEGNSFRSLSLNFLGPVAEKLGDLWAEDRLDFAEVTIGVARLQHLFNRLSSELRDVMPYRLYQGYEEASSSQNIANILLAPVPGDQHNFGLSVLGGFLEDEGHRVQIEQAATIQELETIVSEENIDVLGISVNTQAQLKFLQSTIVRLKAASRNPSLFVMVGGKCVDSNAERLRMFKADAYAEDAPAAVATIKALLDVRDIM